MPLATCNEENRKNCVEHFCVKTFSIDKLIISWTLLKILQNIHGTWREELLWIDHWLELRQRICRHFHANLHPQILQTFSPPWTKKPMLCTPKMDSSIIWPNHLVCKITRQQPTYWIKSHQINTSQGWVIIVLLTSSWSNHVTWFKWDSF